MRSKCRGWVVAGVAGLLAWSSLASPALGHGSFVDARPLPGVEVGGVVDEVALLFGEDLAVGEGSIEVTAPDGEPTSGGPVEYPIDRVIRMAIEPLSEPGQYEVAYRVPAIDGFIFEGRFPFTFDPSAEQLDPLPFGRSAPMPWVIVVAALVGLVGGFWARRRKTGVGR
jgi:methionine-rich copper-binding protein CopC